MAEDPATGAVRSSACRAIAEGLASVGKALWVVGYFIGSDRRDKSSTFSFGSDQTVGVATVAQIGGELANGAICLMEADNKYAASALIRQLVEVEYLASAFKHESSAASTWLRADRSARRQYWTPGQLRRRAGGRFLASDYWHHCELGGHPTTRATSLLPDHRQIESAFLWVDLAGHLNQIWIHIAPIAEELLSGMPQVSVIPEVNTAISAWLEEDELFVALQHLGSLLEDRSASGHDSSAPDSHRL